MQKNIGESLSLPANNNLDTIVDNKGLIWIFTNAEQLYSVTDIRNRYKKKNGLLAREKTLNMFSFKEKSEGALDECNFKIVKQSKSYKLYWHSPRGNYFLEECQYFLESENF